MSDEKHFEVGEAVAKPKGYAFDGFIVSRFQNRAGHIRYVVEHAEIAGMLHIFSAAQLISRIIQ
ncbi:MAG: hypothetical protein ACTHJR_18110 [Sphingomonas sp.]|uniref:hypothetical protein n=1 Tax=Sphingomonas sp. TaxID=28214 RepID=UPI003F7E3AE9